MNQCGHPVDRKLASEAHGVRNVQSDINLRQAVIELYPYHCMYLSFKTLMQPLLGSGFKNGHRLIRVQQTQSKNLTGFNRCARTMDLTPHSTQLSAMQASPRIMQLTCISFCARFTEASSFVVYSCFKSVQHIHALLYKPVPAHSAFLVGSDRCSSLHG